MKKTKILAYSLSVGSIVTAGTVGLILYSNNMNSNTSVSRNKFYSASRDFVEGLMNKDRDTISQFIHTRSIYICSKNRKR